VLSAGVVLGLLLGAVTIPLGESHFGLGTGGGLLLAGIVMSGLSMRLRFVGSTPNAARNVLADLGLVAFVAIVAMSAGTTLGTLPGELAVKIMVAGVLAGTLPLLVAWAVGFHVMKINPAILLGVVAGARAHPESAREAAQRTGSHVPWIGFPVAYAVSIVLLTLFGLILR
jgi:putative transport protein